MKSIPLKYKIIGAFAIVLLLLLFFLSSMVKAYLVRNSESLIGRKIQMDELHFNYLKVAVNVVNFKMFEANKTDTFISFNELYINFDPWSLIGNEYAFSEITLKNPYVKIQQYNDRFNFDDLLEDKDSTQTSVQEEADTTVFRFTIKNILMDKGLLIYEDKVVNNHLEFDDLNLNIPLISWDSRRSDMGIDFRMGEKGQVSIGAQVDNLNQKYTISLNTKDISIKPLKDYLTSYVNINSINGLLSSRIQIKGDMQQVMNVDVSGTAALDSIIIIDENNNHFISADRVESRISKINLMAWQFDFSAIKAINPKISASLDRDASNFEKVLQPYLADTLTEDSSDTTQVTYRVDTLTVINGLVHIADNTLNRAFAYDLKQVELTMHKLTESSTEVPVQFSVNTNDNGTLSGNMVLDMVEPLHLDFNMNLKRMGLLSFSPYSEYFIASPVTQGWMSYDMSIQMTPQLLKNQNKIRFDELELGKRTKDSTAVKVPVKLALYILKDPDDVISIDLPVEGNPSEPQFAYRKLLWKTLGNFFVKTATAPFNAMAGLVSTDPESLEKLPFNFTQRDLDEQQKETLLKIATIMNKKPDLEFSFIQFTNLQDELKAIALERAKNEYVTSKMGIQNDSAQLAKAVYNIRPNDREFLAYLHGRTQQPDSVNAEDMCFGLYNQNELNDRLNQIIVARNQKVKSFLIETGHVNPQMLEVTTTDWKNVPEELKFPHFKVEVSIQ